MRNALGGSLVLMLVWAAIAEAQTGGAVTGVPARLNHQGRLLDAAGNPVAGTHTLTFSIYKDATGGSPVWSETQAIAFDGGYYSTTLGAVQPFPVTLFSGQMLYMAVAVDNTPELAPREPIVSVPYAVTAVNAVGDITPKSVTVGGAKVIDETGKWVGPAAGLKGDKGDKGDPGPVDYNQTIRNGTAPQAANFNITGSAVVGGFISAGLILRGTGFAPAQCSNTVSGITDCSCDPAEFVVSGGGFSSDAILRESRPIGIRTWRVACVDKSFNMVYCSGITIVCSRLAP